MLSPQTGDVYVLALSRIFNCCCILFCFYKPQTSRVAVDAQCLCDIQSGSKNYTVHPLRLSQRLTVLKRNLPTYCMFLSTIDHKSLFNYRQGRLSPLKTLEQDPPAAGPCPLGLFPSYPYRPSPVLSLCTSFRGMYPLIPFHPLPFSSLPL